MPMNAWKKPSAPRHCTSSSSAASPMATSHPPAWAHASRASPCPRGRRMAFTLEEKTYSRPRHVTQPSGDTGSAPTRRAQRSHWRCAGAASAAVHGMKIATYTATARIQVKDLRSLLRSDRAGATGVISLRTSAGALASPEWAMAAGRSGPGTTRSACPRREACCAAAGDGGAAKGCCRSVSRCPAAPGRGSLEKRSRGRFLASASSVECSSPAAATSLAARWGRGPPCKPDAGAAASPRRSATPLVLCKQAMIMARTRSLRLARLPHATYMHERRRRRSSSKAQAHDSTLKAARARSMSPTPGRMRTVVLKLPLICSKTKSWGARGGPAGRRGTEGEGSGVRDGGEEGQGRPRASLPQAHDACATF
mmetsp:Transcript_16062/g.46872  ORF Transcript_16062/g.46872 Transcript_16062/m.46872 type:complete len:367 (-) Transcript_16062:1240-2340(-)